MAQKDTVVDELTRWVDRQVVGLTDQLAVVARQVKQVTCIEQDSTHGARETADMVDGLLGTSDDVRGWNSAAAAAASRPVPATRSNSRTSNVSIIVFYGRACQIWWNVISVSTV